MMFEELLISPDATLHDAMATIDRTAKGIVLVTDENRRLINTVTDGDIRRAILSGLDLNVSIRMLLERRPLTPYPQAITAPVGTSDAELIHLMNKHVIRHVPLLDDQDRVTDLALLADLVKEYAPPLRAVVMAGGLGKRLRPLTEDVPKPMLPVGGRPLMEHIIGQLCRAGIKQVSITTHYKPEAIVEHFGDGRGFGVQIDYMHEDRPLGTAGALGLMPPWNSTLLVVNGDILTRLNYQSMLAYHRENRAALTVAACQYDVQVPYGVLECDGPRVSRIQEKPTYRFFTNAGIYLVQPEVRQFLPNGQRYDMTDLIEALVAAGWSVMNFPILEYWLDIGQAEDYRQAQEDVGEGKLG
jgi:dTDP-glucose pyrophosphorylase